MKLGFLLLSLSLPAAALRSPFLGRGRRSQFISERERSYVPSSNNCTWRTFVQPLDHFNGGQADGLSFEQRVCINDKFFSGAGPILFYTGNESPVEEYVNNTGLMWTMAPKLNALVVFAEHRYFGESIPVLKGVRSCLSYCTSQQALADYATLVDALKAQHGDRPVIAFGGSYGGMLASWARMKYPVQFQGAVAGSAPIFGFPLTNPPLDGAFQAITHAASAGGGCSDDCKRNFLASWPVIDSLGQTAAGRNELGAVLGLCRAPGNTAEVAALLDWLQAPLFDLAEGDYPFPSTYISFAVGNKDVPLPAWPMRVACQKMTGAGVRVELKGSPEAVSFSVLVDTVQVVAVDWNVSTGGTLPASQGTLQLLDGLRQAVGVWYNLTHDVPCFDPFGHSGHEQPFSSTIPGQDGEDEADNGPSPPGAQQIRQQDVQPEDQKICTGDKLPGGNAAAWGVLVCNEGLNLVNYLVKGVGRDMYWPPNQPRNFSRDAVVDASATLCQPAYSPYGLFGLPQKLDAFAKWDTTYYGGLRGPQEASNIVFSNGALDPWSTAGVVNNVSSSVVAVVLPEGGHHLDLFFPDPNDPPGAVQARQVETTAVNNWIQQFYKSRH